MNRPFRERPFRLCASRRTRRRKSTLGRRRSAWCAGYRTNDSHEHAHAVSLTPSMNASPASLTALGGSPLGGGDGGGGAWGGGRGVDAGVGGVRGAGRRGVGRRSGALGARRAHDAAGRCRGRRPAPGVPAAAADAVGRRLPLRLGRPRAGGGGRKSVPLPPERPRAGAVARHDGLRPAQLAGLLLRLPARLAARLPCGSRCVRRMGLGGKLLRDQGALGRAGGGRRGAAGADAARPGAGALCLAPARRD